MIDFDVEKVALRERFELSSAEHTGCLLTAGSAITSNPAPYQAWLPEHRCFVRLWILS